MEEGGTWNFKISQQNFLVFMIYDLFPFVPFHTIDLGRKSLDHWIWWIAESRISNFYGKIHSIFYFLPSMPFCTIDLGGIFLDYWI